MILFFNLQLIDQITVLLSRQMCHVNEALCPSSLFYLFYYFATHNELQAE